MFDPVTIIGLILGILIGAIMHEVAHGYVADRLGDPTARISGRLTLDPRPHIDPIGSVLLPLMLILIRAPFLFGWAKPVPIDPFNFRNPRRDILLVSAAGVAVNFAIAILLTILFHLLINFAPATILTSAAATILVFIIFINVILGVFNLIPVPPLDGSKILTSILPKDLAEDVRAVEPYGIFIILLLWIVPIGDTPLLFLILQTPVAFILDFLKIPLI